MSMPWKCCLIAGLASFVLQAGCMSYQRIELGDAWRYDEVRIERSTGQKENLRNPHTAGDTLVGIRASGDTLRMSLGMVHEISVGRTDWAKTGGLIGGIVVVSFAVFAISMSGYCGLQC